MEIQVIYYNAVLNSFIIVETDMDHQISLYSKNMNLNYIVCLGVL